MQIQLPESPLTRENYHNFVEYEGKPVISSSALHHIYPGQGGSIKRLKMFLNKETQNISKPHLSLGTLFHKYLEDKNNFEIEPDNLPDPGIVKIIQQYFNTSGADLDITTARDTVVSIARSQGYQNNWKDDTVFAKVSELGASYYRFLIQNSGKHMLTVSQGVAFEGMRTSVLESEWAEEIFHPDALHEVPVLWKNEHGIWCKALIDWLRIFPSSAGARIIDFKTTSKPVGLFHSTTTLIRGNHGPDIPGVTGSFYTYYYYRQLEFYKEAVTNFLTTLYSNYGEVFTDVFPIESIPPYECAMLRFYEHGGLLAGRQQIHTCMEIINNELTDKF